MTAHNALLLLRTSSDTPSPYLDTLKSGARSILYSAHLVLVDSTRVLVAAGTVFGQILFWSCLLKDAGQSHVEVHKVLSGHDGSVFGVRISSNLQDSSSPAGRRFLASCSDDRTIRIWDVSDSGDGTRTSHVSPMSPTTLETGFASLERPVDNDFECLAQAWGHVSRIWSVHWLPQSAGVSQDPALLQLLSCGEDGTCVVWSLAETGHLSKKLDYNLTRVGVMPYHVGKNVWSAAINSTDQEQHLVATGGADGRVVLCKPQPTQRKSGTDSSIRLSWSLSDACPRPEAREAVASQPDHFIVFSPVTPFDLLLATAHGHTFSGSVDIQDAAVMDGCAMRFSPLPTSVPFSHIVSSRIDKVAFLATKDGDIHLYVHSSRSIRFLQSAHGKIAGLFLSNDSPGKRLALCSYGAQH